MLNTFSLQNGVKVATYNLPNLKSIHVRLSVKGGSIVENKLNNGVAHFMEHMLVQGIPSYPTAELFSRYIEGLAGNYGAFTERLLVGFNITVPATHFDDAIGIASEVFFEPLFDPDAIEKERIAIIDEVLQRKDSHLQKISEYFLHARFNSNHPLLLDGGGDISVLNSLQRADLITYWQQYFYPANTYIHVSGNFSNEMLRFSLEKHFGMRKPRKQEKLFPTLSCDDFTQTRVSLRKDEGLSTCYSDLTFPSIGLSDDLTTRLKQNLALVILGQLRNSRLFRLLRYSKGLVYDVRAGSNSYPGLGYVYISFEAGKEYLDEALQLILAETMDFIQNGPTEEELSFAKNYLTNQWLMTFDHPSSIAEWVESNLLWDEKALLPEDYAQLIKNISVSDIVSFMHTYWNLERTSVIIQGPIEDKISSKNKYQNMLEKLINTSYSQVQTPLYS